MEFTTLGKTGLKVSVAGLGCGGPSRLGLKDQSKTEKDVIAHVRGAVDLGINFFDTAEWYGTEAVVGKGLAGVARDRLVISTKKNIVPEDHADPDKAIRIEAEAETAYVKCWHERAKDQPDFAGQLRQAQALAEALAKP